MSKPLLAQIAYAAWAASIPWQVPSWRELSFTERIAWGKAIHAAVVAAHTIHCDLHVEIERTADLWRQAKRKTLRHDAEHAGLRAPKGAKSKRVIKAA